MRRLSHPLESWFMDRLELSFMARLGTLIYIFECVFVTSRESAMGEKTKQNNYKFRHLVEYKKCVKSIQYKIFNIDIFKKS